MAFRLLNIGSKKPAASAMTAAAAKPAPAPKAVPKPAGSAKAAAGPTTVSDGSRRALPFLGGMRVGRQYTILGALFAAVFLAAAVMVVLDNRSATYGTVYVATSTQMRMLSQRIAKAAQTGLTGNAQAFKQLRASRDQFVQSLKLLTVGGNAGGVSLPPTSDEVRPSLRDLAKEWDKSDQNVTLVLAQ